MIASSASAAVLFPPDLAVPTLLLLLLAAFAAGWVDAVVGGGGLLQLPALLLVPGLAPVQALATNKLGSIFGTSTSALTYYRRARPDLRTALPMAAVALVGSFGGASIAAALPVAVFKPVIVVALVTVATITLLRPTLGGTTSLRFSGHAHYRAAVAVGLAIGVYDGVLGPGTGTFLVIAMVSLLGYDFLQASAKAKIVNFATNLGALLFFVPHGSVVWGLALLLGAANVGGSYLGSRMAIASGTRFIRTVFLVVVAALIVKVGHDVWVENLRPLLD
ncbi:sulfite exporter TauE/SafE family protein [Kineococcus sp. GCM10028916]|uniref:sulfite exporter TauE/SafE family protein n=1 Tax=Kineococcus sp. GCM10028916 TaxID=3273394 RepID=UPI003625404D